MTMDEQTKQKFRHWSTTDEIFFIQNLGEHTEKKKDKKEIIKAVLGYKDSLDKRWNWGRLDKNRIYDAINEKASKLMKRFLEVVE